MSAAENPKRKEVAHFEGFGQVDRELHLSRIAGKGEGRCRPHSFCHW